jgi:hypothetical protein
MKSSIPAQESNENVRTFGADSRALYFDFPSFGIPGCPLKISALGKSPAIIRDIRRVSKFVVTASYHCSEAGDSRSHFKEVASPLCTAVSSFQVRCVVLPHWLGTSASTSSPLDATHTARCRGPGIPSNRQQALQIE